VEVAYENRPLPIGHGQTISQPFIVAYMTELLELTAKSRVLEIGTGCGYQTAILAELAKTVHTIEVIPELAERARETLSGLSYKNIHFHTGNGRKGWPEAAPFEAIMVTAASADMPAALVDHLAPGGRMVIPVGAPGETQLLTLVMKDAEGRAAETVMLRVAFVPLV